MSPCTPPSLTNGSFHDLQQGSFNLWRMEISVFVYRQLLPFISKLCIWKRRKDLMPLFAAEQMFKDTAESSLSQHNFRGWNWKVLQAPWLPFPWHLVPLPTYCSPGVRGQRGITSTFSIYPDRSSLCQQPWGHFRSQPSPVAVPDKSPLYSSVENSIHAAPRCSTHPNEAVVV